MFLRLSAASPKVKVSIGVAPCCSERPICLELEGAGGRENRGVGGRTGGVRHCCDSAGAGDLY